MSECTNVGKARPIKPHVHWLLWYVCIWVKMCVHVCMCLNLCMCVNMFVYACICVHMCVYVWHVREIREEAWHVRQTDGGRCDTCCRCVYMCEYLSWFSGTVDQWDNWASERIGWELIHARRLKKSADMYVYTCIYIYIYIYMYVCFFCMIYIYI